MGNPAKMRRKVVDDQGEDLASFLQGGAKVKATADVVWMIVRICLSHFKFPLDTSLKCRTIGALWWKRG
jgi:hypothetical protein